MIDIIIPAYNAHKTIKRTLSSIAMQSIKNKVVVTIIDDASDKDYKDIVSIFKDIIKINEIRLKKNSGAGVARQYGLDNTSGKYIMFVDADDVLYDIYSLERLYTCINKNDIAIGKVIDVQYNEKLIMDGPDGSLHAKMYRRSFIERENIRFSEFRTHEDNSFNRLCNAADPLVGHTDEIVYVYEENNNSVTKKEAMYGFNSCKEFCDSMFWLVKESEKRGYAEEKIGINLLEAIMYIYKVYNINYYYEERDKLKVWVKDLIKLYKYYRDYLDYNTKMDIYFGYINGIVVYEPILDFLDIDEL